MGLCVVSHSSLASCTFPTTLWLFKKNTKKHLQWNHDMHLKITFCSPHLHPGSSMLTAGITIHYVSAGKGCRGPGRSSHHISLSGPVSEIITCTDKLPGSYFFFFFIALSSIKQADVWKPLILVSGHMYCSLSLTWSHGPALCQRLVGFSKAPLYILSFITVTSFKVKTCSWRMEDREAISHPFRYPAWYLISSWMIVNGERPFLVTWRLYDVLQLESRSLSKISRSTNLFCGKRLSELNLLCHTMLGWGTNHHKSDCVS